MDEVLALWQAAVDIDAQITTVEAIKHSDRQHYCYGPLLITSCHLEDVGLKGCAARRTLGHSPPLAALPDACTAPPHCSNVDLRTASSAGRSAHWCGLVTHLCVGSSRVLCRRTERSKIRPEEVYEVEDVSDALEALGLPSSFGSKVRRKPCSQAPR